MELNVYMRQECSNGSKCSSIASYSTLKQKKPELSDDSKVLISQEEKEYVDTIDQYERSNSKFYMEVAARMKAIRNERPSDALMFIVY